MAVHRAMRSCRLADDLYLKAKYIATTEKRSFNNWLEIILQKEIAAYEKENGPILVQTDDLMLCFLQHKRFPLNTLQEVYH